MSHLVVIVLDWDPPTTLRPKLLRALAARIPCQPVVQVWVCAGVESALVVSRVRRDRKGGNNETSKSCSKVTWPGQATKLQKDKGNRAQRVNRTKCLLTLMVWQQMSVSRSPRLETTCVLCEIIVQRSVR